MLYHCAAQVHQRSTAQARRCSNAFHLGPEEMHFTMRSESRGQVATAPRCNLFDRRPGTSLPARHVGAQVQFQQNPARIQSVPWLAPLSAPFLDARAGPYWRPCEISPVGARTLSRSQVQQLPSVPQVAPDVCVLCPLQRASASGLTFVDSGQLASPGGNRDICVRRPKTLSKYSKCVLWEFTRAHLRTVY